MQNMPIRIDSAISRPDAYTTEIKNQLQQLALGGAVTFMSGITSKQPSIYKAGVALGVAGLVGLFVLAVLDK